MDDMDEVISEFLVESHENLDRLDREFVELEHDPTSREILASIFRTIHTIKGTAGFLGFDRLGAVSHEGESLLSLLRDGTRGLTPAMTSTLLAMVDAVRQMLEAVEQTGADGDDDYAALVADLAAFVAGDSETDSASEPESGLEPTLEAETHATGPSVPAVEIAETANVASAVDPHPTPQASSGPSAGEGSIRVDVRLLDQLMNLVGELVLARNQILQYPAAQSDSSFANTSQQLNLITTELQEGVMKTRMQPIGNIWSKLPRVVRDLALSCEKSVRIEMDGEDTELDKTILEAIKDPLTHAIRNSVDHGIEPAGVRESSGKPIEGVIRLRAFHEGGQVVIEIGDDGGGLDATRIQQRAAERGLITADQASRMSDQAIANLIFLPGFSTATEVTSVSGRGVGMDVVKTNIEKIGGTVDIHSVAGVSTTLTVRIPLTLAIIPALVITCADDRYAIPQVNLVELVRLEEEQAASGIEFVGDTPVYRLRGRLLPIVYLRDILDHEPSDSGDGSRSIVVLQADDRQFGLVVDGISDTEEIVVKPLGQHLKAIQAFTGTTIMGDGTVALILDAIGIAQQANVLSEVRERNLVDGNDRPDDRRSDSQSLIVCLVNGQRVAIPLGLVDRLEEFDPATVEHTAGREVVQYRGRLLALVHLKPLLGSATSHEEGPLQVLVISHDDRVYGFVVDAIVDIVEIDDPEQETSANPLVDFAGVIGRRVTDVININEVVKAFESHPSSLLIPA